MSVAPLYPGVTPAKVGGKWVDIITPDVFTNIPNGTRLISLTTGERVKKGTDKIRLHNQIYALPTCKARSDYLSELYGKP